MKNMLDYASSNENNDEQMTSQEALMIKQEALSAINELSSAETLNPKIQGLLADSLGKIDSIFNIPVKLSGELKKMYYLVEEDIANDDSGDYSSYSIDDGKNAILSSFVDMVGLFGDNTKIEILETLIEKGSNAKDSYKNGQMTSAGLAVVESDYKNYAQAIYDSVGEQTKKKLLGNDDSDISDKLKILGVVL